MTEVLQLLSSTWLRQGNALYSRRRLFGDKLQVTKQKAYLKSVILIFQVEISTAHVNPSPHLDIEAKLMCKSELCQNQGECWCWLWQVSGFASAASGLSYSPVIWSHRDLDRFAKPRGTFQVEDLDACVTAPSRWGDGGGNGGQSELQGGTPETTDSSACLIKGVFLISL